MMKTKCFTMIGIIILVTFGCSNTKASKISEWEIPNTEFPLAEPGPHYVGVQEYSIIDESRDGREIELVIWYPSSDETDALSMWGAPAYERDGPYPLILTGDATGGELFKEHLATYGFIMVEVQFPDSYASWDIGILDHSRDLLFALDQITSNPPNGLEGIIDTDNVGVTGYSIEGLYTLFISGAQVDSDFYQAQCADAEPGDPIPEARWIDYNCNLSEKWDAFVGKAGP
jgi:predicted dienelactone hydrolase